MITLTLEQFARIRELLSGLIKEAMDEDTSVELHERTDELKELRTLLKTAAAESAKESFFSLLDRTQPTSIRDILSTMVAEVLRPEQVLTSIGLLQSRGLLASESGAEPLVARAPQPSAPSQPAPVDAPTPSRQSGGVGFIQNQDEEDYRRANRQLVPQGPDDETVLREGVENLTARAGRRPVPVATPVNAFGDTADDDDDDDDQPQAVAHTGWDDNDDDN